MSDLEQEKQIEEVEDLYGSAPVDPDTITAAIARKQKLQELRAADPSYPHKSAAVSLRAKDSIILEKRNHANALRGKTAQAKAKSKAKKSK